jgi:hypothetical protein
MMEKELAALKQELDALDVEIAALQHRKFMAGVRFQLALKTFAKTQPQESTGLRIQPEGIRSGFEDSPMREKESL